MVIFFFWDKNSLLKARNRKNKTERNTHIRKKKMMMIVVRERKKKTYCISLARRRHEHWTKK